MIALRHRTVVGGFVAATAILAAACKGDSSGPDRRPASLSAESPVALAAPVGSVVALGGSVTVRDRDGQGLAGVAVTFTPAPGSGSVEAPTARTNASGVASSGKWTLGTASGTQRLVARVARVDSVEFVVAAVAGAPASVSDASETTPSGTVAVALQALPSAVVRDQFGNPIAGVPVAFAVRSGGGTVAGATTVTNLQGLATVGRWTLGIRSGPQSLTAQVSGVPDGIPTVNAMAGAADVMRLVAGADEINQVGRTPGVAPRVSVRDVYENPVAGRRLTVRITQGGGTLHGDVVTDDAGLAELAIWSMGPIEGLNSAVVEVDGLPPLTIHARAVPVSSYDIEFRFLGEVTPSQRLAFERAATRWRKVIIGDVPNLAVSRSSYCGGLPGTALNEVIDDIIIFVQLVPIDGPGKVLGSAGPCSVRPDVFLTHVGSMKFDTDDVAELEAEGSFADVVLHEVGHILGIGTLWRSHGLLVGEGEADPYYVGESGRAGFTAAGGLAYAGNQVPVENSGGAGTRDGHWRESVLNREVMTGFIESPGVRMPLSLLTIGALEDLGYQVTSWGDDPYTYGTSLESGMAARARVVPDRQLIEVPMPPPEVATATGQSSPISARIARPVPRQRRVTAAPRPVQQLEVRRPR